MDMASRNGKMKDSNESKAESDLLLHPELLSEDFIKLVLHERKIKTEESEDRDHLTDLYIQHVIPLPQRELPNSRWGKRIEKTNPRHSQTSTQSSSTGTGRKRPLIVFDNQPTKSGSVKLKRADDKPADTDRLKPPPSSIDLSNPIRKLTGSSSQSSESVRSPTGNGSLSSPSAAACANSSNLSTKQKRAAPSHEVPTSPDLKSPEVKKKIQHVTWP
ncbi:ashwin [Trichomycterus rosablanca]|uniref:ashwin n=1 Tax=Trichomycterus rosablanca TaxID=2290929 RepID=UPI002F3584D0